MNKIEAFIHEKNMSMTRLAEVLDYDVSYISLVVNGKRPITDAFRWRWLEAFGPSALRVLNGDSEPQ